MKDPVCGAHLEEIDTAVLTCYKGQLVAFCSLECLDHFSESPEGYIEEGALAHAS